MLENVVLNPYLPCKFKLRSFIWIYSRVMILSAFLHVQPVLLLRVISSLQVAPEDLILVNLHLLLLQLCSFMDSC